MNKGIFIIGTDTDVGKTIVTAGLVYVIRKAGIKACSFKAVESGGILKDGELLSVDTGIVRSVAGLDEVSRDIARDMNPYCFKTPVSPHLAASLEKIRINKNDILKAFNRLAGEYSFIVAEGSGGLVVPLIENQYYIYDLIKELDLPIIIVSRTTVGTINHTVLTIEYARKIGLDIKGIIFNGFNGKVYERDNIQVIKEITNVRVLGIINQLDNINNNYDRLKHEFTRKIDYRMIVD